MTMTDDQDFIMGEAKQNTGGGSSTTRRTLPQHIFANKINDDLLVEIFDFCRLDNISPNTYPRNWWYTLAHVCQKWRRVLFASPTRLGITLVCNSRTPVGEVLAHAKLASLPIVIYWANPGTFDTDDSVKNALRAIAYRDRVRRLTLQMPESSLSKVFSFAAMDGLFPILETLQLSCSTGMNSLVVRGTGTEILGKFRAPNLRHVQLSDLNFMPASLLLGTNDIPSIVTLSIGEITTKVDKLMGHLALMPRLKVLKIGVSFSIPSEKTERAEKELCKGRSRQPDSAAAPLVVLTDLEELEYQGVSDYLEAVAARISAPFIKKVSVTITNKINNREEDLGATTFKHLSRLISGASDLAFQYARVRFKDGFSIVMDHDELWTGRGAFELRFNNRNYYFDADVGLVAKICRVLAPMPSTVQSFLLEDAHRNYWQTKPDAEGCHELLRVFDNVRTLRVAGRFVGVLDKALEPPKGGPNDDGKGSESGVGVGLLSLVPRLQEIVRYDPLEEEEEEEERDNRRRGRPGDEKEKKKRGEEFVDFVKARQEAGLPVVRVVKGPQYRLTLV